MDFKPEHAVAGDDERARDAHRDHPEPGATAVLPRGEDPSRNGVPSRNEDPLQRGQSVGRYVIVDKAGSGGMAVVYAAYDPELDRKVAIKVLSLDEAVLDQTRASDVTGAKARALREAQALAQLSHPNVLPIYDVGTVDGQLFLATEFVEGRTLHEWVTENHRPWPRIVDAFIQAGRGLAAAHARGIVHRDFKPHNVLVDRDDHVRVMDFGLARKDGDPGAEPKASDPTITLDDQAMSRNAFSDQLTAAGTVMGTPAYMAPEQHDGLRVDAKADQFAFCVALYEALHGQRPFRATPDYPLSRAKREGRLAELPASNRARSVPGWLRRVVARGLAADPEERWPSMDALLQALERNPMAKARNAALAVAATAVLVTGGLGYAAYADDRAAVCGGGSQEIAEVWGPEHQASIEQAFLATEVPYAQTAWSKSQALLDRYAQQWSSVHREACEATSVRQEQSDHMLDLRMACLDERFLQFRAVVDVLGRPDEKVVENAVKAASSLSRLERCSDLKALQNDAVEPPGPEIADEVERIRTGLAEGKALFAAGKIGASVEKTKPYLDRAEQIGYGPLIAEAHSRLGQLQMGSGALKESVANLAESAWRAHALGMDTSVALSAATLVYVEGYTLQRPEQGMRWAELAEATIERIDGHAEIESLLAMNRGSILARDQRYKAAHDAFERALTLRTEVFGPHRADLSVIWSNLAVMARKLGRHDEAVEHIEQAIDVAETAVGPDHPMVALPVYNLGQALVHNGQHDQAEPHLQRALRLWRKGTGKATFYVAHGLAALGDLRLRQRRYDEADTYLRQAKQIRVEVLGPEHPEVAGTESALALLHEKQAQWDEALPLYRSAAAKLEQAQAADGSALVGLGRTLLALGEVEPALSHLERALEMAGDGESAPAAQFALARALWAHGDEARAHQLVQAAIPGFAASEDHRDREQGQRASQWLEDHPLP